MVGIRKTHRFLLGLSLLAVFGLAHAEQRPLECDYMAFVAQEARKEATSRLTQRGKAIYIREAIANAILARIGPGYEILVTEYLSDLSQYEEMVEAIANTTSQSEAAAALQFFTGNLPGLGLLLLPEQDCNRIRNRIQRASKLNELASVCRDYENTVSQNIQEDRHSFMRSMQFLWQGHGYSFDLSHEQQASMLYEEFQAAQTLPAEYAALIGTYCMAEAIGEYKE
ncbi:hypothetical protein S7S_16395 [Isoalcanivorax pacificus W11-5]|jgi:hypothetical protein|uniref:DUF2059 domain-containing protein n=1 Tax=Isoalcanivorax pacificus W11-5 TaxID=391936 RepID=A0A0B4XR66_9GAMM|nr:hypothetical protein [Isoalcanivorax pacificus]AJD49691.1 hypothetical protein S7S_16395 [Isoalcanivorax pacificus W11-5]